MKYHIYKIHFKLNLPVTYKYGFQIIIRTKKRFVAVYVKLFMLILPCTTRIWLALCQKHAFSSMTATPLFLEALNLALLSLY